MIAKYQLTRNDFRSVMWLSFTYYRPLKYLLISIPVAAGWSGVQAVGLPVMVRLGISLISILIAYVLSYVALRAVGWLLGFLPTENTGVLGEHTISISPEEIIESTNVNRGSHSWAAVTDLFETKKFVIIVIARTMFHVIPKRSFESPDEASKFLSMAMGFWQKSKSSKIEAQNA